MNRRKNTRTNTIRPMLLTIPQVAELLSLGRTKVYELIAKEGLPSVKLRHHPDSCVKGKPFTEVR